MTVLETERLRLRRLSLDDAAFILDLLNEPSFLNYIGDKGVRTLDDARDYILTGPMASYERHGFGLYLVELKERGVPMGICGLLKRDRPRARQHRVCRARVAEEETMLSGTGPVSASRRPITLAALRPRLARGRSWSVPQSASQSDLPWRKKRTVFIGLCNQGWVSLGR